MCSYEGLFLVQVELTHFHIEQKFAKGETQLMHWFHVAKLACLVCVHNIILDFVPFLEN